ncbi:hypothetical protein DFH27DRAFT_607974 [Peziza echinospora]|nr:hypothetical protein DFH27DRAFT_607974 [Peziza echinospora]
MTCVDHCKQSIAVVLENSYSASSSVILLRRRPEYARSTTTSAPLQHDLRAPRTAAKSSNSAAFRSCLCPAHGIASPSPTPPVKTPHHSHGHRIDRSSSLHIPHNPPTPSTTTTTVAATASTKESSAPAPSTPTFSHLEASEARRQTIDPTDDLPRVLGPAEWPDRAAKADRRHVGADRSRLTPATEAQRHDIETTSGLRVRLSQQSRGRKVLIFRPLLYVRLYRRDS